MTIIKNQIWEFRKVNGCSLSEKGRNWDISGKEEDSKQQKIFLTPWRKDCQLIEEDKKEEKRKEKKEARQNITQKCLKILNSIENATVTNWPSRTRGHLILHMTWNLAEV